MTTQAGMKFVAFGFENGGRMCDRNTTASELRLHGSEPVSRPQQRLNSQMRRMLVAGIAVGDSEN